MLVYKIKLIIHTYLLWYYVRLNPRWIEQAQLDDILASLTAIVNADDISEYC